MEYAHAPSGALERWRRNRSGEGLRSRFRTLAENDRRKAVELLREPGLTFGTLFLLAPELREFALAEELSPERRLSLQLSGALLHDGELQEAFGAAPDAAEAALAVPSGAGLSGAGSPGTAAPGSAETAQNEREALRWMFRTGARDDGLSDRFDQLLDAAAATLFKRHRDSDLLPLAAGLLFARARKGAFYQDLAWAFFQTGDPRCLLLLARRLRSRNPEEAALARTLLHLPEGERAEENYRAFLSWHRENGDYVRFRPGGFQVTGTPKVYGVDLEAKYLGRARSRAPEADGAGTGELTAAEYGCLCRFREQGEPERLALASYSRRLLRRSPARWKEWMREPVEDQLRDTGRRRV